MSDSSLPAKDTVRLVDENHDKIVTAPIWFSGNLVEAGQEGQEPFIRIQINGVKSREGRITIGSSEIVF